ncbi:hypothetical protein ACHAPT_007063 [Fusarium lateritium]
MASPTSPSMPPSRNIVSDALEARGRIPGNTFAQLVSKFEILDAMSSASNRRDSHAPPKAMPASVVASSAIVGHSPWKPSAQGSTKTRDRSSTDSSLISPGCFIPPKQTSRARRSQTLETKPPIAPTKVETAKPRQKSVAERRKLFEMPSDVSGMLPIDLTQLMDNDSDRDIAPSTPIRTSTSVRSPSKLAHSKSWKSMKTSLSILESHLESTTPPSPSGTASQARHAPSRDQDSTSTLLPASSTEEYPSRPLAPEDPFGAWKAPIIHPDERWMALKRDSFAVTAFDTSPSYIKSQYIEPEPHVAHSPLKSNDNLDSVHGPLGAEKQHSMEETRQQGWVQNARKMAYSLSNSMSAETTKVASSQSPESTRNSLDAFNAFRSFQFTRTGTLRRSNLPRSRISSLRKKFDLPKSETVSFLPVLETKQPETASGNADKSDWRPKLSLPKSATTSDLGTTASLASRSKSYAPRWRKQAAHRPQTPAQRRKTEHNVSPLKQKIDLFESLDHQNPAFSSPKMAPTKKRSVFGSSKASTVGPGPLKGLRGTLRRISTSYRKSPSEWSTTSSRPASGSQHSISDIAGSTGKVPTLANSEKGSLSPHTIESIPERPVLGQTRLENEISPLDLGKRTSMQQASLPRTGLNVDGESGPSQVMAAAAPAPLFSESQSSRFFRTKIPLVRTADRFSLPDFGNNDEEAGVFGASHYQHPPGRGLLISKAHCRLEQPKPVRANELRRLVGICKQKVRKLSAGGSE